MRKFFVLILSVSLILPGISSAAISSWDKATSVMPRHSTDFASESFKQSLRNLKESNANMVSLVIPYYQSSTTSADIQPGGNTPTDAALIAGINSAKSEGLEVSFVVHIDCYCGIWRAHIDPTDNRAAWYSAYGNILNHLGTIAQQNGVKQIVMGTELILMTSANHRASNTADWQTLISNLRKVYSGSLTYSSNWGESGWVKETDQVQFWGDLDQIGISAYYPLRSGTDSVQDIKNQWDQWNLNNIKPLNTQYGKPIKFTEIGYQSANGARFEPWNYDRRFWAGYNGQEQANLYEALFQYWNGYDYMQGVNFWQWESDPNSGWPGNTDYTPQHKPAEEIVRSYFAGTATPPTSGATFNSTASTSGTNHLVGQPVNVNTGVTNSSGTAINSILVDLEVYNSAGSKVHQVFHESQNFAVNETKSYSFNFTPASSSDTYTVKIGVFNSSWATNYHWNSTAGTFTAGQNTPPPPAPEPPPPPPPPSPTIYILDNWWPADGATLSGVQPFKAMVEGMDVNTYTMYWQVDGGALNLMATELTDYPHKESLVDVSGWFWRANGPYQITFVAHDNNGNIIAQKTINIYVSS